jgi:hypothetical protein
MKRTLSIILLCLVATTQGFAEDGWQDLFDGKTLNGWEQVNGSAKYVVEDGAIVGTAVPDSPNSFLATRETYSDFILEFEAKVEGPLNSGVQFRSLSNKEYKNGRVHGYQCEIDPSERSWTGGVFDEARSKWLYPMSNNEAGQKAFKHGEWNRMRVEAIGPKIRTWVNGVPTANLVDNQTAEGFIALQVHGIGGDPSKVGKQVRWRHIRIKLDNPADESWYMGDVIEEYNYIPNHLTARQKAEGWKLLWDGKTTKGWRGAKLDGFPPKGWEIKDGVLSVLSSGGAEARNGGDIVTLEEFSNFELEVDFKISAGANSGIKYFVDPDLLKGEGSAIGLEFQILDDELHPDAKMGSAGNRTVASLYDLITASNLAMPDKKKGFNGVGIWNRARIVVLGGKVEHWLNGNKVVEFDRFSQMFRALVARSKYAKWPNFGAWEKGPILLQDHGDLVHFRSIKIRALNEDGYP